MLNDDGVNNFRQKDYFKSKLTILDEKYNCLLKIQFGRDRNFRSMFMFILCISPILSIFILGQSLGDLMEPVKCYVNTFIFSYV